MEITKETILTTLSNVLDPDLGIDIVSLGLIYEIKITTKKITIIFTLTSPQCPYADYLVEEIETNIKLLKTKKKIDTKITFNPPWTPEKMDPDIRAALNL